MRAAVWDAERRLTIADTPAPVPADGEVLVKVTANGICGSDLHQLRGDTPVRPGLAPGHEIAGTVVSGPDFAPGTPVAVEPLLSCGVCGPCHGGRASICETRVLLGMARSGGLQELLSVPSRNVYELTPGTPPSVASLSEPLAVSVRAINLARIPAGGHVMILGAGTIGLLTLLVARAVAAQVSITARHAHQASVARKLGATTVLASDGQASHEFAAANPVDVVVETVGGNGETLTEALNVVRPGGRVVALGIFSQEPPIPATRLVVDEVTLVGSLMYGSTGGRREFGAAVALLGKYASELGQLQTHRFPLGAAQRAYETAADKSSGALKVTIDL